MIQMQSNLEVADNSGARRVQCIKVLGGSGRKIAGVGDIIVVSVKEAIPRGKVKKGDVYKALIIRTKSKHVKKDGSVSFFKNNAISLINKQEKPIAKHFDLSIPLDLCLIQFTIHSLKLVSAIKEVLSTALPGAIIFLSVCLEPSIAA